MPISTKVRFTNSETLDALRDDAEARLIEAVNAGEVCCVQHGVLALTVGLLATSIRPGSDETRADQAERWILEISPALLDWACAMDALDQHDSAPSTASAKVH